MKIWLRGITGDYAWRVRDFGLFQKSNVFLKNVVIDGCLATGEISIPNGQQNACCLQGSNHDCDILYVQSHKNVAKVWLPEPFKDAEGMMLEGLACIGVVCQDPGDGCIRTTFRVVPGRTCLLPVKSRSEWGQPNNPWTLVEGFSGGFGGWFQAMRMMQQGDIRAPWNSCVAIEVDQPTAEMYAINHCSVSYDFRDPTIQGATFPVLGPNCQVSSIFIGPICDCVSWMKLLPWENCLIYSMSPPCAPWSLGTLLKDGFCSLEGQSLCEGVMAARFFRPPVIAIENVCSITTHRHFRCLIGIFLFCGYKLIWQSIEDMKKISPASRRRWLAVFVRVDLPITELPSFVVNLSMLQLPKVTLGSFRVFGDLPESHEKDLTLDEDLKQIYGDPRFAKEINSLATDDVVQEVLNSRVRGENSQLATIVASYGNQHMLPIQNLVQKGIFAELCSGKHGIRFFSPVELFYLLCPVLDCAFPVSMRQCHLVIGNAIGVPHAALALCNACAALGLVRVNPVDLVLEVIQKRLHAGNTIVELNEGRLIVRKIQNPIATLTDSHVDPNDDEVISSPPKKCLKHETKDVSPIPATMPFVFEIQLRCITVQLETAVWLPAGSTLKDALKSLPCELASMIPVTEQGIVWPLSQEIPDGLTLYFGMVCDDMKRWFESPAKWIHVDELASPLQTLRRAFKDMPGAWLTNLVEGLKCYDMALNERDIEEICRSEMCVLIHNHGVQLDMLERVYPVFVSDLEHYARNIHQFMPEIRFGPNSVVFLKGDDGCENTLLMTCHKMIAFISPMMPSLGWKWISKCDTTSGHRNCFIAIQNEHGFKSTDMHRALGVIVPVDIHSSPSQFLQFTLLKGVVGMAFKAINLQNVGCVAVRIKFEGIHIWSGRIPGNIKVDHLILLWNQIHALLGLHPIQGVFRGKRVVPGCEFLQLLQACDGHEVCLHLVGITWGGGAKQESRLECKNLLARELLGRQFPLSEMDFLVNRWIDKVGTNRILRTLQEENHEKRWGLMVELAKTHNIPYVAHDPVKTKAASIIQRAVRKKQPLKVLATNFALCHGYFTLPDDTFATLVPKVEGSSQGVILLSNQDASPWLNVPRPLMPDAFGVITLEKPLEYQGPEPEAITFPATDDIGRQVVLRGYLWQLGEEDIKFKVATATNEPPVQDSIVVSVVVWKDEAPQQVWAGLEKNFIRTVKEQLGVDSTSLLQVWGRVFFVNSTRCDFMLAASAQCFLRIHKSVVEGILGKSGVNGIYTVAKADNHLPHPDWSVIWLGTHMQCVLAAQKIPNHSGIVRGRNSWGIRCHQSKFSSISKELRPDLKEHEAPLAVTKLFKIDPIPVGISDPDLVGWGKQVGWNFRIVKRLGKSAVLVGSDASPPEGFISLQGNVVLVKEINTNKAGGKVGPQIAGPRGRIPGKKLSQQKSIANPDDPWEGATLPSLTGFGSGGGSGNPWANYSPTSLGGNTQHGGAGLPAVAKQPEGPVAAKFQAFDDRMSIIEKNMQKLQEDQKKADEKNQRNHQSNVAQFQAIDTRFGEVQQAMQTVQTQIQSSICDAVQKQEARLGAQFDQIMLALKADKKEVRPPSQKRNGQEVRIDEHGDATMTPVKSPPSGGRN